MFSNLKSNPCLDQKEIQNCLPSFLKNGKTSGETCQWKNALEKAKPCILNTKCKSNSNSLNTLFSAIPKLGNTAPVKGFCSVLDQSVGLFNNPPQSGGGSSTTSKRDFQLNDVLDFAKWTVEEVVPCAADACNLSSANTYSNLTEQNVILLQQKMNRLIEWKKTLMIRLILLILLCIIIGLISGFFIGKHISKSKQ